MHRRLIDLKNSTIVRFIMVVLPFFLVTGCGTVASLGSDGQPLSAAGPAICQSFGPETRCSRTDSMRVARELESVNRSARSGFRGW